MNILAIDSITPVLSVTTCGKDGTTTISLSSGTQHSQTIITVIDRALEFSGFSANETNLVICAEGPGSFTGLRLAYATVKAIQLAASCPFLPVPSLLCYALPFSTWKGVVVSVLDAKKRRFYVQLFRKGQQITDSLDITENELLQFINPGERILITGPDAALFSEGLEKVNPVLDLTVFPSGKGGISDALIFIAEKHFSDYNKRVPDDAGPLYVRKSDAETKHNE